MKLRIKFTKHGTIRFIGHLDLMRYFQKAFRRAELDIAYSEGYSPHQIMSFSAPLSVGFESDGEYMDVTMNSIVSTDDVRTRLEEQMAEGIEISAVGILPEHAQNAMASVAAAGYYIDFRDGFVPPQGWKAVIANFLAQEHITVIKKAQKSEREIDLKDYIYEMSLSSYHEKDCLYLLVNASSSGNIKPAFVLEQVYAWLQLPFDAFNLMITREDTYLNLGDAEHLNLAPLDAICVTQEEADEQAD